ncbi:MAG: MoxR family ATPase [Pseudomonadota bacterium]
MQINEVKPLAEAVRAEVAKVVVGQDKTVDLLLTTLFSGGHILLEGPPGTAKTLLAQCFAAAISLDFGRIQFTPDLMPGDVLGTNIFNFQTNAFKLTKGPIFSDILLADEINRTPPKTQAALLEAMQERQVTIDGERHPLHDRFFVIATQNPIEQQGTYPLPEAQLDRFLFKHVLDYPSRDEEIAIVGRHGEGSNIHSGATSQVAAKVSAAQLNAAIDAVGQARINDENVAYIVDLIRATRDTPTLATGASPRAAAALSGAARARAALDGRDYVIPDDIKALAHPTLRHRVILSPAAEIEGRNVDDVISQVIDLIEAPR